MRRIETALSMIFWSILLGMLTPNLVGFLRTLIMQTQNPEWVRMIHPLFSTLTLVGVAILCLQSHKFDISPWFRSIIFALTLIEVVGNFYSLIPYPFSAIFSIVVVSSFSYFFYLICNKIGSMKIKRLWIYFALTYALFMLTAIVIQMTTPVDPTLQIYPSPLYSVEILIGIWGLSLLNKLKKNLSDQTCGYTKV